MRASNIEGAPGSYPDRYRGEPSGFERAAEEFPGPPAEATFDLEVTTSEPDSEDVRRALEMGGWASDRVTLLGRLVATAQAAGCYYAGLLVPVDEGRWRLWLRLVEE